MALRDGIGATSSQTSFFAAVSRCRARLTEEGVDLAAYDLPAMAQDGVDLRHALGIDTWGITTYGSMSLVGLEMLREDPAHIDAMVLDSPAFPQEDPLATAVTSTTSAIKAIFHDCAVRARCAAAYPRLPQTLHRAVGQLDDHPITVSTETPSGQRFDVRVDGAALLRALRTLLRDQTDASYASEPAATYAAADGDVSSIVAPLLAFSPAFCAGYLPTCDEAHAVSEGTYLSVMCRDFAWSEGHPQASGSTSATRGLSKEVFASGPVGRGLHSLEGPPGRPIGEPVGDVRHPDPHPARAIRPLCRAQRRETGGRRADSTLDRRQLEWRSQRAQPVMHDRDPKRLDPRSNVAARPAVSVVDPTEAVRHRPPVVEPVDRRMDGADRRGVGRRSAGTHEPSLEDYARCLAHRHCESAPRPVSTRVSPR